MIMPPLVNGKIIINFKEKANLFNKCFLSQCNPLPNDSNLPENQRYITILQKQNYYLSILRMKIYTK